MITEIKVYLVTKYLFALYGDELTVQEQLILVLGDALFWENWMERYHQLDQSKETQIMLLREANFTYRQIQKIVGVSPNTIQTTVQQFKLDYVPLSYSEPITEALKKLEYRFEREGVTLW